MPKSRNKRKNRKKNMVRKQNEMNRKNNERRRMLEMGVPLMLMHDKFLK